MFSRTISRSPGGVAQLAEQRPFKPTCESSSLSAPTGQTPAVGVRSLAVVDPEHPSTPRPTEVPPDLSVLAEVERELADVEGAMARIDEGTYGTCVVCGAAIPDERLADEPAATRCAEHRA